jgi:hypothetical protein
MAAGPQAIASYLLAHRLRYDPSPGGKACGLYAYFIDNPGNLLPVKADQSGLVYVGMSEDGADARSHFTQASSFSELRRSLGAILKHRLELTAVARGKADKPRNALHYGFTPEGEARLSDWMKAHLRYSVCPDSEGWVLMEKDLIRHLCPPLCLTAWKNPQALLIRGMRKACADEARQNSESSTEA